MFEGFEEFITTTLAKVHDLEIQVKGLQIDHIARTTSTKEEYDGLRPQLLSLGRLVAEDLVGGRRVGIVELSTPLKCEGYVIPGVELIEPVEGSTPPSGITHLEFVLTMGYQQFMDDHPGIDWDTSSLKREEYPHLKIKGLPEVKFHEMTIFETVERQHRKHKESE